jgi:hypothetical protein
MRWDRVKSSNRVLIFFGIGIGILVMATVILVVAVGRGNPPLLSEDTPQGIVQRYLQAVQNKDYAGAYGYLAPAQAAPDNSKPLPGPPQPFDMWIMSARNTASFTWKASLGNTQVTGNIATVELIVEVFSPSGPFGNPVHTNNVTVFLKRSGSSWLITSPTDLYWVY